MAKLELTEILHKQERRLGTVKMKVEDPNATVTLAWEHDKTAKRCHCSSSDPKDNLPEDREVHRNVQNKCKPPKGYLEALGPTNNTEKQTHHAEVSAASTGLCPSNDWHCKYTVSGEQSHQRGHELLKHFSKLDLKC